MIKEGTGDLLAADVDALVNTVNCVGVMGKGIALQFKRRYPKMFKAYQQACRHGEVRVGRMFVVPTDELNGPQFVINFPTKRHWRSPSKIEFIEDGLADLRRVVEELGIQSIAIPPLGAGNGGLDWDAVEPRIRAALDGLPAEVTLFAPAAGHRAIRPAGKHRMTYSRALLLELLRTYVGRRLETEP
ncbi:MAG TPA: macro domain-containing protein, partial [Microlunatus sp.]